jgi:hypothetical protein
MTVRGGAMMTFANSQSLTLADLKGDLIGPTE